MSKLKRCFLCSVYLFAALEENSLCDPANKMSEGHGNNFELKI